MPVGCYNQGANTDRGRSRENNPSRGRPMIGFPGELEYQINTDSLKKPGQRHTP